MFDPKIFDDITKKIGESVPDSLKHWQAQLEQNMRAILQSAFAKMELVTRQEFDVQTQVLAKTRARLEALESQLKQLEQQLIAKNIINPMSPAEQVTDQMPDRKVTDDTSSST